MINTTLKTLSQVSGLSISTVSRALKNHPDISEKTKLLINELATTLDYEPNANAIHLRTKDSRLFGLIVPSVSNFFYDSFIGAVEEESRKNNYSLIILQSGDDPEIEQANIKLCRQSQVSGVFACLTSRTQNVDAYQKLKEVDIPVIFFDKVPDRSDCHKICIADSKAATIAARVIVEKHKKNILAIFGNRNFSITKHRLQAFTAAIKEGGIENGLTVDIACSSEEAEMVTNNNLLQKPDVVFCMSDEILVGVMRALQKKELRAGIDISVIAISNGFIPTLFHPQITYVETSGEKLGKLAFSGMMNTLGGSTFIQDLAIDSVLVPGGSL